MTDFDFSAHRERLMVYKRVRYINVELDPILAQAVGERAHQMGMSTRRFTQFCLLEILSRPYPDP